MNWEPVKIFTLLQHQSSPPFWHIKSSLSDSHISKFDSILRSQDSHSHRATTGEHHVATWFPYFVFWKVKVEKWRLKVSLNAETASRTVRTSLGRLEEVKRTLTASYFTCNGVHTLWFDWTHFNRSTSTVNKRQSRLIFTKHRLIVTWSVKISFIHMTGIILSTVTKNWNM